MGWTYERSPRAAVAIESKRRIIREQVKQVHTADASSDVDNDWVALRLLEEELESLATSRGAPCDGPGFENIAHRPGQPIHFSLREKPFTSYFRLEAGCRRTDAADGICIMIDFWRDGDRRSVFESFYETVDGSE